MMAMAYENAYVAQVAFGAKDVQTIRAFMEAESFDGPSVIIAYSPSLPLLFAGLVLYGLARTFPDANMLPVLCQIVDRRVLALGFGILNLLAVFVGGASIYAGGALRDAQVPITVVFTVGALTMAICVALLWKVRTPTASSSAPSPSPS
jgi:hypothetical protein